MADWTDLEGDLRSPVAAASWGEEETQVFGVGGDGAIWQRYWDGESWHGWESLGGEFTGEPGAAARDADRIDVFAIATTGRLRHRFWDGSEWTPWDDVPGAPQGATGVSCAWVGGERLDVFARLPDGTLRYLALTP
jgi:hypothetical protein